MINDDKYDEKYDDNGTIFSYSHHDNSHNPLHFQK